MAKTYALFLLIAVAKYSLGQHTSEAELGQNASLICDNAVQPILIRWTFNDWLNGDAFSWAVFYSGGSVQPGPGFEGRIFMDEVDTGDARITDIRCQDEQLFKCEVNGNVVATTKVNVYQRPVVTTPLSLTVGSSRFTTDDCKKNKVRERFISADVSVGFSAVSKPAWTIRCNSKTLTPRNCLPAGNCNTSLNCSLDEVVKAKDGRLRCEVMFMSQPVAGSAVCLTVDIRCSLYCFCPIVMVPIFGVFAFATSVFVRKKRN